MPYKRLLLFLLSTISISLFASDSTQTWNQFKRNWDKTEIVTNRISVKRDKDLIGSIEVLDIRSDTERVGIYSGNFYKPCQLVFDSSFQHVVQSQFSSKSSANNILLVIRNFWINDVKDNAADARALRTIDLKTIPATKLKCTADAFIKQEDGYVPLTQFDTILTDKNEPTFSCRNITEEALKFLYRKLEEAISSNLYTTKKKTSKENIIRVYSKRFIISVLADTTFKKGVYYTWEQFKNNLPVDKEYVLRENDKNQPPSLFMKDEKGEEIPTRTVFAISDGKQLYKIQEGFAFQIYRNYHGIYWMGIEKFDLRKRGIPLVLPLGGGLITGGLESTGSKMKIRLTPYLINLETGEEY